MSEESDELEKYRAREAMVELVDERLERALRDREPLEPMLADLLPRVAAALDASSLIVRTFDEALEERSFAFGLGLDGPSKERADRAHLDKTQVADARLLVHPLDVAGEDFGSIVVVGRFDDVAFSASMLRVFAETLDNHLAAIALARIKYLVTKRLTDALREPVLDIGLDKAIEVIRSEVQFDAMLIAFRHEDDLRGMSLRYRILRADGTTLDSRSPCDATEAGQLRKESLEFLNGEGRALLDRLGMQRVREEVLIHGVRDQRIVGRVVVTTKKGEFHTHDRELLDRFADSLRLRIVDYNREWKVLSQSFPIAVVDRMLQHEDYVERFLRPRVKNVAILYADISGFSRISEQVLVDPERIGKLIDGWGEGVVDIVWSEGGVFDKMVGDCVIAFFGPPLFEDSDRDSCEHAIRAARAIRDFTRTLMDGKLLPELRGLEPPIGVATGVHFAPLNVGIFGPDEDYTGFSSGMNNTARLQGVATRDEILCMDSVVSIVEDSFEFSEERQAKVKNVAEPLRYRLLVG